MQIQLREDFTETHYNKIVKNQAQRNNFEGSKKKAKTKTKNNSFHTREIPEGYKQISQQKP